MRIACLFDGAGLARLGLEQAGHDVTGFELDPVKHYLGKMVGRGDSILQDATTVDLSGFDGVWASPPCQLRSSARTQGNPVSEYSGDYLNWCLNLPADILWVENIFSQKISDNSWGKAWNAAQFEAKPRQNRNRVVGGRYLDPDTFYPYRRSFPGICLCVLATEYKGHSSDGRRAAKFYGRRLELNEVAYHMGIRMPAGWMTPPPFWTNTRRRWDYALYEALGNGVVVQMARAFGLKYAPSHPVDPSSWDEPQMPDTTRDLLKKGKRSIFVE